MIRAGDAPIRADYDELVDVPYARDGIVYLAPQATDAGLRKRVLSTLLESLPQPGAWAVSLEPSTPIERLGLSLSRRLGWNRPAAALVHRDLPLGYHRDTQNPYSCRNITTIFRLDVSGGALVIPDARVAFACDDGWTVGFDGQQWHGLTSLYTLVTEDTAHWRFGLTYYSPKETPVGRSL